MEKIQTVYRNNRAIISAVLGVAAMAFITWLTLPPSDRYQRIDTIPLYLQGTLQPEPQPLTAFSLTDQNGKTFDLKHLKGKWTFMFFGYTSCPDICPTTLTVMNNITLGLARKSQGNDSQFVFVSVDPERDDPSDMGRYVKHFNPGFIGITGTPAQLDNLTNQLKIMVVREEGPTSANYQIGHTSSIMLVDPQARLYASFSPPLDAEEITRRFGAIRIYYTQEENQ